MFVDFQSVINLMPTIVGYGLLIGFIPSFISWAVWELVSLFKYMAHG